MIHGDLTAEHIIASEESRRLEGIVDWANACCGSRFYDFIGLWSWGGDSFVAETLRHYNSVPAPTDWALIRSMGLVHCLSRYWQLAAVNEQVSTLWLERINARISEIEGSSPSDIPQVHGLAGS